MEEGLLTRHLKGGKEPTRKIPAIVGTCWGQSSTVGAFEERGARWERVGGVSREVGGAFKLWDLSGVWK